MQEPHLIYVADPMCSWCWGFAPVLQALTQRYAPTLALRLVLGGLRPWNRQPMGDDERASLRRHWDHVHAACGQPFNFSFFKREHFVYDSEPASRAVVVLRRHGMALALAGLHRIQQAFYTGNQDVTDTETLVALARELGLEAARFRHEFTSDEAREETRADFALTQAAGVRGFPTLIAAAGSTYELITHGFQPADCAPRAARSSQQRPQRDRRRRRPRAERRTP